MGENNAALAYYSIRSKQEYIYRTNAIKEIAGASSLITKSFGYLYDGKDKKINYDLKTLFDLKTVKAEFDKGNFDGIVLFEGGGNLVVLYKDKETCLKYNRSFSKALLQNTYSLTPLCAFIEVDLTKDDYKTDYKTDYRELMNRADEIKKTEAPLTPFATLPFSLMDRDVFLPVAARNKDGEFSAEAYKKRGEYKKTFGDNVVYKELDDLVTEKGKESLLAVVYADGNNMGKKIGELLKDKTGYNDCINALRNNSNTINKHFIENGMDNVKQKAIRQIIGGGDEVTFICNAHDARPLAEEYLKNVNKGGYSSCAGIAIFHSHYPFSEAYKIAEEACENAKKKAKKYSENHTDENTEISFIDFQFIHSGIDTDLNAMRKDYGSKMLRPYCICAYCENADKKQQVLDELNCYDFSVLEKLAKAFSPARSCVKEMGHSVSSSTHEAVMSFERICSQHKGMKAKIFEAAELDAKNPDYEKLFSLFYDLVEFYDIWYKDCKEADAE